MSTAEVSTDVLNLDNTPFPLTSIDREILATKDEDYHRITWDDLRAIIGKTSMSAENALEKLKRLPSDLHKYLRWSYATKRDYGSINNFVLKERLHWSLRDPSQEVTANSFTHHSATPFDDPRDYVVLMNDWPYGFEPGIKHLVVWSRTPVEVDSTRGDVTPESRRLIQAFVDRHFVAKLTSETQLPFDEASARVQWLKNWVSLQSVRGIDHVHVLVKDAPESALASWLVRKNL